MATKNKYYAVRKGYTTGIFQSWTECEKQIKGYASAEFKGFPTKKEALSYLSDNALEEFIPKKTSDVPCDNVLYAYVDGSYNIKTKTYGYGAVIISADGNITELFGSDDNPQIATMRNVAGEIKGACVAMQYGIKNKFEEIHIFYDYEGIAKWATGEWKANLLPTKSYQEYFKKIKSLIKVEFIKVLAHSGVEYNEKADKLAKKAVGIL